MKLKKNSVFTLNITAIANNGCGIGRINIDNTVVFVPFTAVGDCCEVKAVKVTKTAVYGKLMRVIAPSPERIAPDCDVFGKCGGCDFRHLSYKAELTAKEQFVRDAFTRLAKLEPDFLPIVGADNTERYRNKAQYPIVRDADSKAVAGFYAPRSHRVILCPDCKLQPAVFSEIVEFMLAYINEHALPVYDEDAHSGEIRHICIRKGHYSNEINVCIVARSRFNGVDGLAAAIANRFAIKGVVLNLNPNKSNVVYGENEIILHSNSDILDTMCGVKVIISPLSFYQINTPMAEKLYGIVADFISDINPLTPEIRTEFPPQGEQSSLFGPTILDLYCGIGTIGLSLARNAKEVIGVERVPSSFRNAKANAALNNITNARFVLADSNCLPDNIAPDVVILDPARKGCDISVLTKAAGLCPAKIIMVSCDPATAARDCARLAELGYRAVRVACVDLFPRTRHVECVAEMVRGQSLGLPLFAD